MARLVLGHYILRPVMSSSLLDMCDMSQAVREISELKSEPRRGWWFLIFYSFNVHPDSWGFMILFDLRIFFKWIGSTTSFHPLFIFWGTCFSSMIHFSKRVVCWLVPRHFPLQKLTLNFNRWKKRPGFRTLFQWRTKEVSEEMCNLC